jgi:hypothetical protein
MCVPAETPVVEHVPVLGPAVAPAGVRVAVQRVGCPLAEMATFPLGDAPWVLDGMFVGVTVTWNVTVDPNDPDDAVKAVTLVASWDTLRVYGVDTDVVKFAVPAKIAVMGWMPELVIGYVQVATYGDDVDRARVAHPAIGVEPSLKVTFPTGLKPVVVAPVAGSVGDTVDVRETVTPGYDGLDAVLVTTFRVWIWLNTCVNGVESPGVNVAVPMYWATTCWVPWAVVPWGGVQVAWDTWPVPVPTSVTPSHPAMTDVDGFTPLTNDKSPVGAGSVVGSVLETTVAV